MTIVATEDTRNLEWRKNNKGFQLLKKMGWNEGEGIGKQKNKNTTALRALKRKEGLGLGAKILSEGGNSEAASAFAGVLSSLQVHHQAEEQQGKVKRKKSSLVLPKNKVTSGHAKKMRRAKFGVKSEQDMACIFGNKDAFSSTGVFISSKRENKHDKKRRKKKQDASERTSSVNR